MTDATYEKLEDRPVNYVEIVIHTELGCDPCEGEYTLTITSFIGSLDISAFHIQAGIDDVSLIIDAIENHVDFSTLPPEGATIVVLKESGEWEDVFWHKYYVIDRVVKMEAR